MQVWSLGQEDPSEKAMETYFSILAWETPQVEEAAGLLSMGSQKSRTGLSSSTTIVLGLVKLQW